ncbi:MAG: 50S ribosomal protein L11 methyltransferase [Paludibacteraceae bacterium]|nr:50S ribosomal protein L11 methyltransferase [Paludibacteraceae bacterium]MBR6043872.1 50S ribosomal protein L11 methyltransferase [Paludibacteraceae bacterium]
MDYSEYFFAIPNDAQDFAADVLPSFFEDAGFDSFEAACGGLKAFAPENAVDDVAVQAVLDAFVDAFPMADGITFKKRSIADKNWNETWERESFRSLVFENRCVVHSPLVTDVPKVEFDVLIDPKQAFGSGSHETTTLMIRRILAADLMGKSVIDVGCGTAILAILAKKKGAGKVAAFDIDKWAYENAITNVGLNGIDDIDLKLGGFEVMQSGEYDYIFANITRNILLDGLPFYAQHSKRGTRMFMSGFLPADVDYVREKCGEYGFSLVDTSELNGWASVECVKL